jgi:hypothetical protein
MLCTYLLGRKPPQSLRGVTLVLGQAMVRHVLLNATAIASEDRAEAAGLRG